MEKHEVYTVSQMKWNGFRNGNLIQRSIDEGFNMILTIDKNIAHQQNILNKNIIINIWNSKSSKIEDIIKFIPEFEKKYAGYNNGNIYLLD